jgi:hypothetical protein
MLPAYTIRTSKAGNLPALRSAGVPFCPIRVYLRPSVVKKFHQIVALFPVEVGLLLD